MKILDPINNLAFDIMHERSHEKNFERAQKIYELTLLEKIELNDNQQILLDRLKKDKKYRPFRSIGFLDYSDGIIHDLPPKEVYKAYRQLDYVQQFEVLAAFAQWGREEAE